MSWSCSRQAASNADSQSPTKATTTLEGEWDGFWGAGLTPGGGIMQPVLASMTIKGDRIVMEGFRLASHVDGTLKMDGDKIIVTSTGNTAAASTQTYTYKFNGDDLLMFDRDNVDTTLHRRVEEKRPIVTDANGLPLP